MIKTTRLARFAGMTAVAAATFAATALTAQTVPEAAQTVPDTTVPQTGLDLPANLQIFGKADPNIRKPNAIVNETVITGTDVDHRIALISALRGLQVPAEQIAEFRLQVLRQLIDETLQVQEARNNEVVISAAELDQSYRRVAEGFNMTGPQLTEMLVKSGSSELSMRKQIEGEIAWSRLLQRRVEPTINVSDAEVKAIIDRLEASKGTDEYHVMEIYLSANPGNAEQVFGKARGLIDQMRTGQNAFQALASTHSEATTAAQGGDLGWVRSAMLPDQLGQAVQTMQIGQIAGPIEIPGGYSILYMVDKRQVLMADPRDSVLNLRQITLKFAAGTTEAQAGQIVTNFAKVTQSIAGCGDVQKAAATMGAEVVDNDQVRVRDLPPQLQQIVTQLQIGEATPPFGTPETGVRALVLCGRDDARVPSSVSPQAIQTGLERERVNLRAQRMLRDLRRDAVVEYR